MTRTKRWPAFLLTASVGIGFLWPASHGALVGGGPIEDLAEIRRLNEEAHFGESEERARALLPKLERMHGDNSLEVAQLLDLLSEAMRRGGKKYDLDTRAFAERAVAIKKRLLGERHPQVATSLHHLGSALFVTGRESEARPILERTLSIREESLGEYHLDTAQSLFYLGSLLEEMGEDDAALELLERGLRIREELLGHNHPEVAWTLNSIGNLLMTRGDLDLARPYYERALRIREVALGLDHPWVSISLHNLALLSQAQGDTAQARRLLERALDIQKDMPPYDPMVSQSLSLLGELLQSIGDFGAARELYQRSLARLEGALGSDHPHLVPTLCSLAGMTLGTDPAQGRALVQRAVKIVEASGKSTTPSAETFSHLAWLLLITGQPGPAQHMAQQAAYGPGGSEQSTAPPSDAGLRALALVHEVNGEYSQAKKLLERVLKSRRESYGDASLAVGQTLTDLALLLQSMREPVPAVEAALRSEEIRRQHFLRMGRYLTERQLLNAAWGAWFGSLDVALHFAGHGLEGDAERLRAIWDAQIRSRALVFDEMAVRHRSLHASEDAQVARLAQDYRRAGTRLANLTVRGPAGESPQQFRRRLQTARSETEQAERRWAERSAAFRTELAGSRAGLAEVMEHLPRDSALVAYSIYSKHDDDPYSIGDMVSLLAEPEPQHYVALVLRPGTLGVAGVHLGSALEIDGLIGRWQSEAARGALRSGRSPEKAEAQYRLAGEALRRRIWDPLTPHLGEPERVFVVPDGALHLVNLATLPSGDSEYLVESGPLFHYLSAERDLILPDRRPEPPQLFVLADPAFDDASQFARARSLVEEEPVQIAQADPLTYRGELSACGSFQERRFPALRGTALEADEIISVWRRSGRSGAVQLAGPKANETAFKALSPNRAVLHVATHGFFLSGECTSALTSGRGIGGLVPAASPQASPAKGENPLKLSGLVLAGANWRELAGQEEEDGILTAEEIAAMDLSGVEWAVLSACETGVGNVARVEGGEAVRGEGLFGLRRAFELAGASTVILSLWSVDDRATRDWMKVLYEARFLDKHATAESVRVATLDLLARKREEGHGAHPFTWGAFVSAGDWR